MIRSGMSPKDYDVWYDTPRRRWIGEHEWSMVSDALKLQPGDSVLDVGCGTGWFTRRAEAVPTRVVGLDIDPASLAFAQSRSAGHGVYLQGDACALPFADASFDKVMSITALCFVSDWPRALAEIVRVSRERFAIGLLNRHSLLYLRKGRQGGAGAYSGARWHTRADLMPVLNRLPTRDCTVASGIVTATAGVAARVAEHLLPSSWAMASFLLLSGRPAQMARAGCVPTSGAKRAQDVATVPDLQPTREAWTTNPPEGEGRWS